MPRSRPRAAAAPDRMGVRPATALLREFLEVSEDFSAKVADRLAVNPTDLLAMEHLMMSGPLSPTELARRLGMSTPAVTTVVDRLVAVGHARRTAHPTDRRAVVVVPEPRSVSAAMAAIMPMIAGIDEVLDGFGADEQATITRYLERVLEVYRGHSA